MTKSIKSIKSINELKIIIIVSSITAVLVVGLNVNSIYQIKRMHEVAQNIYEHPLKVSNAALSIKLDIMNIHKAIANANLLISKRDRNNFIKDVELNEKNIGINFNIIKKNILGVRGMELYNITKELFDNSQAIRNRLLLSLKEGNLKDIANIKKMQDPNHIELINSYTLKLYEYSNSKADEFDKESVEIYKRFERTSILFFLSFFIVFGLLSFYTYAKIRNYLEILKLSKKKLEDTTQKYELAIKGTKDGLWDWNLEEGTIYFSPVLKEMLGFRDDELPNEFSSWEDRVHPDDLKYAEDEIQKAHANPEYEYNIVHRLRHKDGHWVWILDRGTTIFNKDGKAVRMVGFHTDITIQKEQEIKINNLSLLLTSTINSIDSIVFAKDKDFKYLECNKSFEEFIGHTRAEILGKDDYNFFPKERADFFREHDSEVLNTGVAKSDTHLIKKYNGEEIYQLATVSPLMDDEKNVIGIVGTAVDITEIKNIQNKLEEQQELMIAQSRHAAMGEMISMIAHQWRQPISVISMDASNILVDIELESLETESLKEDLNSIISQTQHLSKTIDDFRDFFKPNKLKDKVLASDVFNESLEVIGTSLANNDIAVENLFSTSTKIDIFSRELLQVILNIVKNAKEALVENRVKDRKITNKIYEDENNIIIEIIDNAGGIKDEIIDKIFEPYFSTKDEKNGTGLGLYMSKVIIQKHIYGTLEVKNTKDGSAFMIKLPKNMHKEEPDEA